MSVHEDQDGSEPELEIGSLGSEDQDALSELATIQAEAENEEGLELDPLASAAVPLERPSFFPDESSEHSRAYLDQLVPSMRPADASGRARDGAADTPEPAADGGRRMPSGGLISSILGQAPEPMADQGALAALRTLPRRAQPSLPTPWNPRDPAQRAARLELLSQLCEHAQGGARARLLCAAAEAYARGGELQRARAAYEDASRADPADRLVRRRLRRFAQAAGDHAQSADAFQLEAELAPTPRERSLALCAAAEHLIAQDAPPQRVFTLLRSAHAADPDSLVAGLTLAQAALRQGQLGTAAAALTDCARALQTPAGRRALLLEAARALERTGDAAAAERYAELLAEAPDALGAALGALRCALGRADRDEVTAGFAALSRSCGDERVRAELEREHACWSLAAGEPQAALSLLQHARTPLPLRALTRAAAAAGDVQTQVNALTRWAQHSGGAERALLLLELARLNARSGRLEAGAQALHFAQQASAPQSLYEVAYDALVRAGCTPDQLPPKTVRDAHDALRACAQLARDAGPLDREQALLQTLSQSDAAVTASVLLIDASAEHGDLDTLAPLLAKEPERWPHALRVGPLLTAFDLFDPRSGPVYDALRQQLESLAPGQPIVLRQLAALAPDAATRARLWSQQADVQAGPAGAFAACMAAHYIERDGGDPTETYADALDAVRGHAPGAFGLEVAARARADLAALERVQRELASTSASKHERAARNARLGLLNADSDVEAAVRWLEVAAADAPGDAVIEELCIRLSMDQSPAQLAKRMCELADNETSPAFVRALQLQAAGACQAAGQWQQALARYHAILARSPDDVVAQRALRVGLARGGRFDALAQELERRMLLERDPGVRTGLLEELAQAELARGDAARARRVLSTILERTPSHVGALRGLERDALGNADDEQLASVTLRLCNALSEPRARAAQLQLGVRLRELTCGEASAALLQAPGPIDGLWYALACEALALPSGDRDHLYDALRALGAQRSDPLERAAYALRAAEVVEGTDPARALRDLGPVLRATPEHPLCVEQLARLHREAGDPLAAAEAYEHAGFSAAYAGRAASLFYTAAVLFEDELVQPERARENLARVAQHDVLFADTFVRLRRLLAQAGRNAELKALLEARLAAPAPIEPTLAASLEAERAALAGQLGDRRGAKQALALAVQHDPQAAGALKTLAQLHTQDGEFRQAAATLVQLARVADDDEALADAFYRLGVLYDEALPDPKRAEIAFMRVAALAPEDRRPLERLAGLFMRQGKHDEALRTLTLLIDMTANQNQREQYVVQRAQTLSRMGDPLAAERTLEQARRAAPASMYLLRALGELYERRGDKTALTLHLQRACNTLRAAIELDPADPANWVGLCELLRARDRADGVALVAGMAHALGIEDARLPVPEPVRGLGRAALSPGAQDTLLPQGPLEPLRLLLRDYKAAIAPHLPFEDPAQPASLHHGGVEVAEVAQLFGVPEIRLVGSNHPLCLPVLDEPLTVAIGRALLLQASDAERIFLLARAVAVCQLDCTLLVRCVPEQLMLVLHALWKIADPAHTGAVLDAQEQARVTAALAQTLPPAAAPELKRRIEALMQQPDVSPRRLAASALDAGARLALSATGDVAAALQALLRLRGRAPLEFSLSARLPLCRTDPAIRALLSFAISEVYLEVRRQAGSAQAANAQ